MANLKEILKQNVEEFKRKEQEEKERAYKNRVERMKELLDNIELDMVIASQEGKTEVKVTRFDNGVDESYVEDIKRYFEERGFKVKHKTQTFFNYSLCIGVFDLDTTFQHTLIISWKE